MDSGFCVLFCATDEKIGAGVATINGTGLKRVSYGNGLKAKNFRVDMRRLLR
jgi:hypothetical protein